MNDPYRMVLVNLVSSSLLLLGVLFYIYVYPKKKINFFVLLLLLSVLPMISLLRQGDYESGDFNIHVYRIISFYGSLLEGNLMPSWAAELNATYGLPLFIFNYSLPYYIISLFHLIGFSFIASTKIYLGLTLLLSTVFMYLWIKKLLNNDLAAFTSSVFYLFSPYHLIDVHFRATLGESTIFAIAPLLFLCITDYFKEKRFITLVFICLLTSLLFAAHPLLAAVFLGIAILLALYLTSFKTGLKTLFSCIAALVSGIIASIYVWISFLIYSPYIVKLPTYEEAGIIFYPFQEYFYSPWKYGFLFQGPKGELAEIIGYTQLFIVVASIVLLFKKGVPLKTKKYYSFWIILFLLILFMMHPASSFIWRYIPGIANMLDSYGRLSLATSFCTSILAGYFVITLLKLKTNKIYVYLLLFITIGSTLLNWGHRRVIPEIDDSVLKKNVWISVGVTPYFLNSRWAKSPTYWFPKRPDKPLEIISGDATVKPLKRTSTEHSYIVDAKTPVTIRENTLYFPNWLLKSNYRNIFIYPDKNGVINAKLPKGLQYLELGYEDLPLYKLSKMISAVFLVIMLAFIAFFTLKEKKGK